MGGARLQSCEAVRRETVASGLSEGNALSDMGEAHMGKQAQAVGRRKPPRRVEE